MTSLRCLISGREGGALSSAVGIGRQACLNARYRPRLAAGRMAGRPQTLSAPDLIQNPFRRRLGDGVARVSEDDQRYPTAVPFDYFGPFAVGVSAAIDKPGDAGHDRSAYRLVPSGTGPYLPLVEIKV